MFITEADDPMQAFVCGKLEVNRNILLLKTLQICCLSEKEFKMPKKGSGHAGDDCNDATEDLP